MENEEKESLFKNLSNEIKNCTLCPLSKTRTHAVPGEGNINAKLFFVGEGPGREEDIQGRPFVGEAGRLLDRILEKIGIKRAEVFIGNIIKCRPPNNRIPNEEEVFECIPYLYAQLSLINPKIICILGATALNTLISPNYKISTSRGNFFKKDGLTFFATYHPAAALRRAELANIILDDLLKLKQYL